MSLNGVIFWAVLLGIFFGIRRFWWWYFGIDRVVRALELCEAHLAHIRDQGYRVEARIADSRKRAS